MPYIVPRRPSSARSMPRCPGDFGPSSKFPGVLLFGLTIGVVGVAIVYALVGVLLVRRFVRPRVREGHNDVLVPIFLTAGQSGEQLPTILWAVLIVGGVMVVGMTFMLYMDVAFPHFIFSALMAALIGTLLLITLLLNRPFAGPLAISPEMFEHSISVYDSVDQGN